MICSLANTIHSLNIWCEGDCFSKVLKLFGPNSGATIPFISSQRRGSKPPNFAILLVFLTLRTCQKIGFSKQADCSLTTGFSGPKSSPNFRETGPRLTTFKQQSLLNAVSDVPVSIAVIFAKATYLVIYFHFSTFIYWQRSRVKPTRLNIQIK